MITSPLIAACCPQFNTVSAVQFGRIQCNGPNCKVNLRLSAIVSSQQAQAARQEEPEPEDQLEGMAGALARALAGRNKALAQDSDEDSVDSDDDWSD